MGLVAAFWGQRLLFGAVAGFLGPAPAMLLQGCSVHPSTADFPFFCLKILATSTCLGAGLTTPGPAPPAPPRGRFAPTGAELCWGPSATPLSATRCRDMGGAGTPGLSWAAGAVKRKRGALSAGSPRPCTFIEVCVGISPARGGLHFLSRFMSGSSIKRLCVALSERPGLGALGWGGGARSLPRCRPRGRYCRLSRRGYRDITGPASTWRRRHFRPASRGRG